MNAKPKERICIYCGGCVRRVRKGKGEHIVPDAIGGALTLDAVCGNCNNEFSAIDTELCSRSPLSLVASKVIGAHAWQVWNVDPTASQLLVEGWPDWSVETIRVYPQIIFEQSRLRMYGDLDEMLRFGIREFEQVLVRSMLRAFQRSEAGCKKWLHVERVEKGQVVARGYRFPPRVFSRRSIKELADRLRRNARASFILRYQKDADRKLALSVLENWTPRRTFKSLERGTGSLLPVFGTSYELGAVMRALAKIAVNLLAHCCPNTPLNFQTIPGVIRVITGVAPVSTALLSANGFVRARDIQSLAADANAHSFRLLHWNGEWWVYASFFGGQIGSFVSFPGPNKESWTCADIVAPLRSKDWIVRTSQIIQPLRVKIVWQDSDQMSPTIQTRYGHSELRVERRRMPQSTAG